MKVLLLPFGTRGDVQPFIALARELRDRGHVPVLAAPQRFAGLAVEHGLSVVEVDDGPLRLMDRAGGVGDVMSGARGALALARAMPATFRRVFDDVTRVATTGAGAGADLVVHNGQIIAAPHIAEKLAVPAVLALTVPMYVPTAEFAWPGQSLPRRLPGFVNRASFAGMRAPALMFARTVDEWRDRALGLPRRRGRHDPLRRPDGGPVTVLNAVSRHVVPPPSDWPSTVLTTGYWFLTGGSTGLPAELAAFLDAGAPPVLIGFGSMAGPDPHRTTRAVLSAVAELGVRAVLLTGWGGLAPAELPDDVLMAEQVPHEQLLPRVAAVVHHGGAGTTAAAAAAGCPQVICPFVADQPFWAQRMRSLGVAPAPVPQRTLDADRLAAAIDQAITDPAVRDSAAELGVRIRAEAGVTTAVDQLETVVRTWPQR